jgi:hypothetical protein
MRESSEAWKSKEIQEKNITQKIVQNETIYEI